WALVRRRGRRGGVRRAVPRLRRLRGPARRDAGHRVQRLRDRRAGHVPGRLRRAAADREAHTRVPQRPRAGMTGDGARTVVVTYPAFDEDDPLTAGALRAAGLEIRLEPRLGERSSEEVLRF